MVKITLLGEVTWISGYVPLKNMFNSIKILNNSIYLAGGS